MKKNCRMPRLGLIFIAGNQKKSVRIGAYQKYFPAYALRTKNKKLFCTPAGVFACGSHELRYLLLPVGIIAYVVKNTICM